MKIYIVHDSTGKRVKTLICNPDSTLSSGGEARKKLNQARALADQLGGYVWCLRYFLEDSYRIYDTSEESNPQRRAEGELK